LKILESGGNAIDAAVAVGFALAVTHSSAGNIGGGEGARPSGRCAVNSKEEVPR
jgi:hypothetical protein